MRNGTKLLRTAGFIQILLGLAVILSTYFLIGSTSADSFSVPAEKALLLLTATYAGGAFQILAGIAGILLSKKKTLLTVIFGVLLFIPQLIVFLHAEGLPLIVGNIVLLIFPYLYLRGAYKNWKE